LIDVTNRGRVESFQEDGKVFAVVREVEVFFVRDLGLDFDPGLVEVRVAFDLIPDKVVKAKGFKLVSSISCFVLDVLQGGL